MAFNASRTHPTSLNSSSTTPSSPMACHIDLLTAFWTCSHLRAFALVMSVSNALFLDIHVAQSPSSILSKCYLPRASLNTFRIGSTYLTLPLYPALFFFWAITTICNIIYLLDFYLFITYLHWNISSMRTETFVHRGILNI